MASSVAAAASIAPPCSFSVANYELSQFSAIRFTAGNRRHLCGFGKPYITCRPGHRTLTPVASKKQSFSSFDDLLEKTEKPVLVDFYATWCGPCQFMVPILEQASARLIDKIQVVKIDTEKYPEIADKYRIEALPTFILFMDGKPVDRFEGALTVEQLVQRIENSLQVLQ